MAQNNGVKLLINLMGVVVAGFGFSNRASAQETGLGTIHIQPPPHVFKPSAANDMAIPGLSNSAIGSGNLVSVETSPARDPGPVVPPSMSLAPTTKNTRLRLGLSEDYFFAPKDDLRGEKQIEEAQVRYRAQSSSAEELGPEGHREVLEVGLRGGLNVSNYILPEAPEAYVRFWNDLGDDTRMTVTHGRVKEKWSELDSYWQEELWNPQVRWDMLNPEEQGQMGTFIEISHKDFRFLAFWSPVFLPEQGPQYKVVNGRFTTHSDWFSSPVSRAAVLNGVTDIRYDLQQPSIGQAAFTQSVGAMLEWGTKSYGPWARIDYAYKPNNQPLTPFTGQIVLDANGGYAAVVLRPIFTYQHIGGIDFGYHARDYNFWFSSVGRAIQNPHPTDSAVTYQYQDDGVLISPGMDVNLYRGHGLSWTANSSYLYQFNGGYSERGEFATSTATLFAKPLLYTNAFRAGTFIRYGSGKGQWNNSFTWTQTFDEHESMINYRSEYAFTAAFAVAANLDLLGSRADQTSQSFISRYRGNDRVLVTTQYVF